MKRKVFSTIMVIFLAVALGGCAGAKDDAELSPTPTLTVAPEPTATPAADPTAEPTATPAAEPTAEPTAEPVVEPTAEPTATPIPTEEPTATPLPTATPIPTFVGDTVENVVNGTFPRTGVVVSEGLNVREDAGAQYDVVATLGKNAKVTILSAKPVESGTYWYQVSFTKGGQELSGYASSKFIAVEYQEQTETPVATATPKPTATPTPIPTPAGDTIDNVVNGTFPRTGVVVSEELNVREDAGAQYDVVATLGKKTKVTILSAKPVESGTYWYQVSFTKGEQELSGYANSNFISVDYPEHTDTPVATVTPLPTAIPTPTPAATTPTATPTPEATPTATPAPTESPAATPTPEPTVNPAESISMDEVVDDQAFYLYSAEIQKDMVELKADFASDAAVIAKLPKATKVIVINQSITEEGIWYRIAAKQNGAVLYGYVTSDGVKLLASNDAPVAVQIVENKVRLRNMASATGSYIKNNEGGLITLSMGDFAWIIGEVSGQNTQEKWFELVVEIDGEVYTGYVQEAPVYLMEMVIEAPVIP